MNEEQRVPENCPACGAPVRRAQFQITDRGMLQVCTNCAHPLAQAPVLGDVNMFRDPERIDQPAQLSLPIIQQETVATGRETKRQRPGPIAQYTAQGPREPHKRRSYIAEMRAEIRELDQQIKHLDKLKAQRAELARMLAAAKDIAAEKKQQAKPLRAIA